MDPVALAIPNARGSGAGRGGAHGVQTLPLRESPGFSPIQPPLPRPPRASVTQPSVLVLRGNGSVCSCRFGIGGSESRTLLGPQPDREPHGSYQPDFTDQQSEAQRNSRFCPLVSRSDRDSWGPGVPGSCCPAPPEGVRAPATSMNAVNLHSPSSAHLHRGANRIHRPGGVTHRFWEPDIRNPMGVPLLACRHGELSAVSRPFQECRKERGISHSEDCL